MELTEFRRSVEEMTDEELLAELAEVRRDRITATRSLKKKSTTPKAVKEVENLSDEEFNKLFEAMSKKRDGGGK